MPYAITHNGKAYGPDGIIKDVEGTTLAVEDVAAYNKALEEQELTHFKSGPANIFAYVKTSGEYVTVNTWNGTELGKAWLGERRNAGYGYRTYRRAITVRIFGTLYHGWYMESSGDYCRLKRAKHQETKYAASKGF